MDEILGAQLLDDRLKQNDCSEVVPPGKKDFTSFLSQTLASAPSPDGLPYVTWKCCAECGLEKLTDLELVMRRGNTLGLEFTLEHRTFSPRLTRLVMTSSVSSRLSMFAIRNHTLSSASVAKQTCECQRGFVTGRMLLQNIPDLDFEARKHGRLDRAKEKPLIAAAFPSVALSSIWTVLRTMLLPAGVLQLCQSIYHMNDKFTHLGST